MATGKEVRAGGAHVELTVQDKLQAGLKKASARFKAFGANVAKIGAGIAAAGGAILAPLLASAKQFADVGDQIHKMSLRTGVGAETLSELGFAAEQSGSNIEAVGKALFKVQRNIGEATTGVGAAAEALDMMGLSADELSRLSPDQQMAILADRLNGVENEALRAQLAFDLFGRGAEDLMPLLKEGSAGIEALRNEARELGFTLNEQDAEAAAALTDAWNRAKRSMQGAALQIGAALAPAITALTDSITPMIGKAIEWIKQNKQMIKWIAGLGAGLAAVGTVLVTVGGAISGVGSLLGVAAVAIKGVTAALAVMGGPVTIAIAAVAALAIGVRWLTSRSGEASAAIDAATQSVAEFGKAERAALDETRGLIDELRALSGQQELTASQLDRADEIIRRLNRSHGDFGATVNRVTGEIEGSTHAIAEWTKAQKLAEIVSKRRQADHIRGEMQKLQTRLADMSDDWFPDTGAIDQISDKIAGLGEQHRGLVEEMKALRDEAEAILTGDDLSISLATDAAEALRKLDEEQARKEETPIEREIRQIQELTKERLRLIDVMIAGAKAADDERRVMALLAQRREIEAAALEKQRLAREQAGLLDDVHRITEEGNPFADPNGPGSIDSLSQIPRQLAEAVRGTFSGRAAAMFGTTRRPVEEDIRDGVEQVNKNLVAVRQAIEENQVAFQ